MGRRSAITLATLAGLALCFGSGAAHADITVGNYGPGDLVINEVMPNPTNVFDSAGEWIEVYNASNDNANLDGLELLDDDFDSHTIAGPGGPVIIAPGEFAILARNGNAADNGGLPPVAYVYSGYFLGNSGDEVVIKDPVADVEITRMTYTSGMEVPGQSIALCRLDLDTTDQDNWVTYSGNFYNVDDEGTPGADNGVNCVLPPDLDPGDLIVTEVMPNPSQVFDSRGEFVELFNATCLPINLNGLKLVDDDFDEHKIAQDVIVGPGDYVVLGRNDDPSANGGMQVDYVYSGYFLGNSGDEVVVTGLGGVEITRMTYTAAMETSGVSLQLRCLTDDPADQSNWFRSMNAYGDGDLGTPGVENDVEPNCPPVFGLVCLDVKPGSDTNPINVRSQGVIPVAVYGACVGDVLQIDPGTVTFGPGAATPAHKKQIHYDDIDGDNELDAVFHFRTQETGLVGGDTNVCISWQDWSGAAFTCCDDIAAKNPLMDDPGIDGGAVVAGAGKSDRPSGGFGCSGTIAAPMGLGEIIGSLLPLLLVPFGLLVARRRSRRAVRVAATA